MRSCPTGNDPLEFIFGDLVEDFDAAETAALCALTYFTLPAKVEHIAAKLCSDAAAVAPRSANFRSPGRMRWPGGRSRYWTSSPLREISRARCKSW